MEALTKIGNIITFRGSEYVYVSIDKIDNASFYLVFENQQNIFFINNFSLNGLNYNTIEELINDL